MNGTLVNGPASTHLFALTPSGTVVGAGLTWVMFVGLMTLAGSLVAGIFGFVIALFLSATVGMVATLVLGLPLSLLASRLTRSSRRVWKVLAGQFLSGAVAATAVIGIYWLLGTLEVFSVDLASLYLDSFVGVLVVTLVLGTGISAGGGWALARFFTSPKPRPAVEEIPDIHSTASVKVRS